MFLIIIGGKIYLFEHKINNIKKGLKEKELRRPEYFHLDVAE